MRKPYGPIKIKTGKLTMNPKQVSNATPRYTAAASFSVGNNTAQSAMMEKALKSGRTSKVIGKLK